GHRFFDVMRRGGTITRDPNDPHEYAVGSGYKQSFSWDYEKIVLPISHTERLLYPELQQNPGYKD
ncbi:MAG TPA: RagB/SusD family nutrient uptake outer membrane protein, partial [Bacteroidales bacterium]|nr:RagB/SusD family nutrient uptake outer membrane protein [Bacteroidales bacterium]